MAVVNPMASSRTYAGLFLVTLATLMFEILLTRIFSVTMWYHYAFMAISMGLLGMTVGAVVVYLRPGRFAPGHTARDMALSALGFAVAMVTSIAVHLAVRIGSPFGGMRPSDTLPIILTFVVISTPFVFSGICVALALTRFPGQVGTLYAADLAGAACGCILLIPVLNATDGPTTVLVTAALASAGALGFAVEARSNRLTRATIVATVLLALVATANAVAAGHQSPLWHVTWVKGQRERGLLYEKWNSFSRIAVSGDPRTPTTPITWGISRTYPPDRTVRQLQLTIDANAATVITAYNGDMTGLEHLKYDITNIVHYIRRGARVLIVGSGGGRDILAALMAGQRSVVAVEINKAILDAVNRRFGDFSGHLDRDARVTFINDEARSYIARTPAQFGIIQLSLVDTAAATAAGAYVLTENSLYTSEAWTLLLQRLDPDGVLTVSRWYIGNTPGEMYKVTALASTALKRLGIEDPRAHIVVVRRLKGIHPKYGPIGMGTILVSRRPFPAGDLARLDDVARRMRFDVILSPHAALDPAFARLATGNDLEGFARTLSLRVAPPTDDTPFFFNMVGMRDAFRRNPWTQGTEIFNVEPVRLLVALTVAVFVLTIASIVVPLGLTGRRQVLRGASPLFAYFASIGLGYMLVEISQMQRLMIFLGHPTYGLSVVLFALLVSSGLGSLVSRRVQPEHSAGAAIVCLGLLLTALLVFGLATPHATAALRGAPTPVRILAAASILFPLGTLMGMAFPLGMKLASAGFEPVTPWFWGVNGATSVCASVLAVAISMSAGISASFWTGAGCYAAAAAAFGWACRKHAHRTTPADLAALTPLPAAPSSPGE